MNEPNKEYGWITASTNRELEALGLPKLGDQILGDDKTWKDVHPDWHGKIPYYKQYTVRRPIDPGEGWEIVPGDDVSGVEVKIATAMGWQPTYDGITWGTVKEGERSIAVRRRKSKSSPAMDDGWELVPKEEVKLNEKHPSWQFLGPSGNWLASEGVDPSSTYRRPKSKPEQYGWLKPDCGVEMPFDTPINARLKNGEMRIVMRRITGEVVFFSSHHPIPAPVAYWHRTGPAPEADKFDPCEEAFNGLMPTPAMSQESFDRDTFNKGWQACCDHYKVGDQSKK